MIITVKNPVDQTNVDVEVSVVTTYITREDGTSLLAVSANGSQEIVSN
jgi:hypothetical protein